MDSTIDLSDAESALDLKNIRYQLIRLEDTIIFHFIERVQFPHNPTIYTPGGVHIPDFTGSFLDWMLLSNEKIHAQVRRYQAPDEYPFFPSELPEPFLAPLSYPQLLHPNTVNINEKIKHAYTNYILPSCCKRPNRDRGEAKENYGSSAVVDVACLQSLSRRIHFGKFVAEAKFRQEREKFEKMIKANDRKGLEEAITKKEVEEQVLKRLELKAQAYGRDPSAADDTPEGVQKIDVQAIVKMYRDYVIPMTKEVEIDYLMQRLDNPPTSENGS
ncbi:chorismate mutase [Ascodesmis nigricans]|uniref:Chorismate mutase n=1 Tax=Ascodesmis nigricans TaxID=341454 RepID=A0A4S2N3W9_9PEZI|nr:chorismate mutase [Ascodesmis nigricans]